MSRRVVVVVIVVAALVLAFVWIARVRQAPRISSPAEMAAAQIEQWEQSTITNLGSVVNSKYRETGLAVSGDGRTLFFVSDRPGGLGGRDLWMTRREGNSWTPPVNLGAPVNSSANDGGATLSADGTRLFFTSDRQGGVGGDDLYMARFVNGRWTEVVNLGPAINTQANEAMVYVAKDDQELYFHSDRPGGFGGTDIYVSRLKDGRWAPAENLGPTINTAASERNPYVSPDGLSLYFGTGRSRFEFDPSERVRIATRAARTSEWIKPTLFGAPINLANAYQSCTELTIDGKTMFFISNRAGGAGEDDVWIAQSK